MRIKKNEVRVFKITGNAINELVWELLNKIGDNFFDLTNDSEAIFHMNWDKEKDELIFYALEFEHPHPVDFNKIDAYIEQHIGITTDSVFTWGKRPYKCFSIDDIRGV